MNREIRVVVEIAEQRNREAIEPFRPAGKNKIPAHNARAIGLDQDGLPGKCKRTGRYGQAEKLASC